MTWGLILDFPGTGCQYLETSVSLADQEEIGCDAPQVPSQPSPLSIYGKIYVFCDCSLNTPETPAAPSRLQDCGISLGNQGSGGVINALSRVDWPAKRNNRQNKSELPASCSQITPNKRLQHMQRLEPAPLKLEGKNGFN